MADQPYDPVARRAAFAQEFIGTTNLDQRRRFQADITEAADRDEARRAAEYEQMQRRNPELMRAETGRRKEEREARQGFLKQNLAERRLQWETEHQGRLDQLNTKRLEIQMRQEDRMLRKEALDLDKLDKQEEDMVAIEDTEYALRQKFGPGTPEYRQGLVEAFINHPNVDKSYRQMALKESGFDDPDAAFEDAQTKLKAFPGSRATIPLAGGGKAAIVSPKEEKPIDIDAELLKYYSARARAKKSKDEEFRILTENKIKELEGIKSGKGETPAAQTAAPTTTPNNFTDPASYTKAYQEAPSGTILLYNGKQYRKP